MTLAIGQSAKASAFNSVVTTGAITLASGSSGVVICHTYDNSTGSTPFVSLADNNGNTPILIGSEQQADISNQWSRYYYIPKAVGGAGYQVTGTISGSHSNVLRVVEITTGGLGVTLDNTYVQAGINTSDPFTTPPFATVAAVTMLLAGLNTTTSNASATHSWDSSLTNISGVEDTDGTSTLPGAIGYRVMAATFSGQVTCTEANRAGRGSIFLTAFREVTASGLIGPRMMTGWGK